MPRERCPFIDDEAAAAEEEEDGIEYEKEADSDSDNLFDSDMDSVTEQPHNTHSDHLATMRTCFGSDTDEEQILLKNEIVTETDTFSKQAIINILLNDDYTDINWSQEEIEEAKCFSANDFTTDFKRRNGVKAALPFNASTGVYSCTENTRKKNVKCMFFDWRVNGYREKLSLVQKIYIGARYYGMNKKDEYPYDSFSITITKNNGDISNTAINKYVAYSKHTFSQDLIGIERGKRKTQKHIQACGRTHAALDDATIKEMSKDIKAALQLSAGEDYKITIKRVTNGDVGLRRLLGYCQKDYGNEHYKCYSNNFPVLLLKSCYDEYMLTVTDPMKSRTLITQQNFLSNAFRFYSEHFDGIPPPNINMMLTYMLQSGKYTLSGHWCRRYNRVEYDASQIIWTSFFHARDTSAADVSAVVFNIGDPGDDIYGKFNLDEVLLQAEEARFLRDEHDTTEIYPLRRDKDLKENESGFIPLERHTQAHMQDLISKRPQLHRPITGTLNCPPAPFSCLSSQARGLFERRHERETALQQTLLKSVEWPSAEEITTVTYENLF
jgi:hypothetical protein